MLALTPLPKPSAKYNNGGIFTLFHYINMVSAKLFAVVIYAFIAYVRA